MDKQAFDELAKSVGLAHLSDQLFPLLQPSIRVHSQPAGDETLPIGTSKLGGSPDLPAEVEIPQWHEKPLTFIAQFNLAEVTAYDLEKALPLSGLLSFYAADEDHWGTNPQDRGGERVLFFPVDTPLLRKTAPQSFNSCKLSFETEQTLPPTESPYLQAPWEDDEPDEFKLSWGESDPYFLLQKHLVKSASGKQHRLLGHPDQVQGNLFYRHSKEWRLLLQIDTDDDAGMMWGDVGKIYFLIEQTALKNSDFSDVWFELQCT